MEGSRLKSYGITVPQGTNYKYQIQGIYDKNDPETKEYLEVLKVVRNRMVELVRVPNVAASLKLKPDTPFKSLVYLPVDKVTNEIDPNRNPTEFYKLFKYQNSQTLFLGPSEPGKDPLVISWDLLYHSEFTGRPVIKYDHVYAAGNNLSSQNTLFSMVVDEIKEMGSKNLQRDTLNNLIAEKPELAAAFAQNLEKLKASLPDKLNQLAMGNKPAQSQDKKSEPLTSNPTDVSNFMNQRSGPAQTFAGNISNFPPQQVQQPFPGHSPQQVQQFQTFPYQQQMQQIQPQQLQQIQPQQQMQPQQIQPQQQMQQIQPTGLNLPAGFQGFGNLNIPASMMGGTK